MQSRWKTCGEPSGEASESNARVRSSRMRSTAHSRCWATDSLGTRWRARSKSCGRWRRCPRLRASKGMHSNKQRLTYVPTPHAYGVPLLDFEARRRHLGVVGLLCLVALGRAALVHFHLRGHFFLALCPKALLLSLRLTKKLSAELPPPFRNPPRVFILFWFAESYFSVLLSGLILKLHHRH